MKEFNLFLYTYSLVRFQVHKSWLQPLFFFFFVCGVELKIIGLFLILSLLKLHEYYNI